LRTAIKIASVLAVLMMVGASSEAKTIRFSGYDWTVKSGDKKPPDSNNWDENNVSADERGDLHLRLTQRDGQWYSPQVSLNDRLGFGRYQFRVIGRMDEFDPNVVLGLFNYPTSDVGVDGTNELTSSSPRGAIPGHRSATTPFGVIRKLFVQSSGTRSRVLSFSAS
jgi:hypothetical protein